MAQVRRDYLNNPRARSSMADAGWNVADVISMPGKSTRGYGMSDLHRGMMKVATHNTFVGGYAGTVRRRMERDGINPCGMMPCGQWFNNRLTQVTEREAIVAFNETAAKDLKELENAGLMPKDGWTVAIDFHKICRYDRNRDVDLFKSKYKNGTARFERYISMQCINDGAHLNLGALPVYKEEDISDALKRLLTECQAQGTRIKLVLLDREFFTVKCIRVLNELEQDYLMPCANRKGVVGAINEFVKGKREKYSRNDLSGSDGTVRYTIAITERKRRKKNQKTDPPPKEKYIGFATNVPGIDIEVYIHRWVIETGFAMLGAMRPRTRSRSKGARIFCFLYALAIFNVTGQAQPGLCVNEQGSAFRSAPGRTRRFILTHDS